MKNNHLPSQPAASKKSSKVLSYVAGAIIILGLVVGPLGRYIRALENWISTFQDDRALAVYDVAIQDCVKTSGSAITGQDYNCAIQVAAGFYNQDPNKAIKLCLKYQPFSLKQNSLTLATALCESQIKEKLGTK